MTEISKTADKALIVWNELARFGPTSPQRLALGLGMNRTVVQRLLNTLVHRGVVSRSEGEYLLASPVRRLASSVHPQLRRAARPHLRSLSDATTETVVLQVLDGDEAIVLEEYLHSTALTLQARHEVASRSALDVTASGIAILAALTDAELRRLLRAKPDVESIRERIAQARKAGYAMTSNEFQAGVSGVSVPIRSGPATVASLAILAPTSRAAQLNEHAELLVRTARTIQEAI